LLVKNSAKKWLAVWTTQSECKIGTLSTRRISYLGTTAREPDMPRFSNAPLTEQITTKIEKAKELISSFLGMKIEEGNRHEEFNSVEYLLVSPTGKPILRFTFSWDGDSKISINFHPVYLEWMEDVQYEIKKLNRS
jgi:hypothetical protein